VTVTKIKNRNFCQWDKKTKTNSPEWRKRWWQIKHFSARWRKLL